MTVDGGLARRGGLPLLAEPLTHPPLAYGRGSGFREDFERQRFVPERIREHQGASGSSVGILRFDRLESHSRSVDRSDPPRGYRVLV
jgi:hypothetical protein